MQSWYKFYIGLHDKEKTMRESDGQFKLKTKMSNAEKIYGSEMLNVKT
jgi:hypothetical protein